MARLKPAIENLWPIEINQTNFLKLIELISIVIINKSKNFKVPKYFFLYTLKPLDSLGVP